jgi:hypothetical protein
MTAHSNSAAAHVEAAVMVLVFNFMKVSRN